MDAACAFSIKSPKLKRPPELCYYAFHDKAPETIPKLWKQIQHDIMHSDQYDYYDAYDVPRELKLLLQMIDGRHKSNVDISDKMHEVFSAALMKGYKSMGDIVEKVGCADRVNELRNIFLPFLPPKMHPFVPDHQRIEPKKGLTKRYP